MEIFADAALAAFPYLSMDDRRWIEDVIFLYQPRIQNAIKVAHEIKTHGETDPWSTRSHVNQVINGHIQEAAPGPPAGML